MGEEKGSHRESRHALRMPRPEAGSSKNISGTYHDCRVPEIQDSMLYLLVKSESNWTQNGFSQLLAGGNYCVDTRGRRVKRSLLFGLSPGEWKRGYSCLLVAGCSQQ